MPLTPTGLISLPKSQLRTIVSGIAAFQARVGAANATAALARIYRTAMKVVLPDASAESKRPFAVICTPDDLAARLDSVGPKHFLDARGGLSLYLTDRDRFPNDIEESTVDFENFVGAVWEGIDDAAGDGSAGDALGITSIELELQPQLVGFDRSKAQEAYWQAALVVRWEA